jgi:hypothetical protein
MYRSSAVQVWGNTWNQPALWLAKTNIFTLTKWLSDFGYDHLTLLVLEAYRATIEPMYDQQPDKWAEAYTGSLQNLAVTYKSLNRAQEPWH